MVILLQDDLVDSCKAGDDVVRNLARRDSVDNDSLRKS